MERGGGVPIDLFKPSGAYLTHPGAGAPPKVSLGPPICMRKPGLIQIFIGTERDVFPVLTSREKNSANSFLL